MIILWLPTAVSALTCCLFFLLKSSVENKSGMVAFGLLDLLSILYVLSPILFFTLRLVSIKLPAANWANVGLGLTLGLAFAGISFRYPTMRVLNLSTATLFLVAAAVIGFTRLRH